MRYSLSVFILCKKSQNLYFVEMFFLETEKLKAKESEEDLVLRTFSYTLLDSFALNLLCS